MSGRVYDKAQWKRLRLLKLRASPLCEDCRAAGVVRPATVVDHVVPIKFGGERFPGLEGLRSLCAACHGAKTARGPEAGQSRTTKPRRGCDANGRPLDAAHPWAAARGKIGADQ
jgi:5-methylcytosine-specific restriction protein A